MTLRSIVPLLFVCAACGKLPAKVDPEPPAPPPVPVTTLTPPPGPFNGKVTVKLEADLPSTVFLTTDGTDPGVEGPTRVSGPSPLTIELTRTATLTYFARTEAGGQEAPQVAKYSRAGAVGGTISGVVVVGGVAVGKEVVLQADGVQTSLGSTPDAGELPFVLTGLDTGQHRLTAMADRNGDGNFWPVIDLSSDVMVVPLDLADPYKASAENVRIYLQASQPGLCTIKGVITIPKPAIGLSLSISALSTSAFTAGFDPQVLLAQLRNGYQVIVNDTDTQYPYAITDLACGQYVPVPMLTGFGSGGLAMNFLANPLRSLNLGAGETGTANFSFGAVTLSGTATVTPPAASPGIVYGVVSAKTFSMTTGIQGVLMPTVFLPDTATGTLKAGFAGQAMRENSTFKVRVFTSLDGGSPLTTSLAWTANPLAPEPGHVNVATGTTDVTQDIVVP
jgi:hypothetical protein